jgi:hypothetical protein
MNAQWQQWQLLIGAALIAGAILLSVLTSVALGGGRYSISGSAGGAYVVGPTGAVYFCGAINCSRVKYD